MDFSLFTINQPQTFGVDKATLPEPREQELGTEENSFSDHLLGRQVNESPEWLQEFLTEAKENALEFGQDAALPIPAENASLSSLKAFAPIPDFVTDKSVPFTEPAGSLSENRFSVESNRLGVLPSEAMQLLQHEGEELEPDQFKQIVQKVWGENKDWKDIQEVRVDGPPEKSQVDTHAQEVVKLLSERESTAENTRQPKGTFDLKSMSDFSETIVSQSGGASESISEAAPPKGKNRASENQEGNSLFAASEAPSEMRTQELQGSPVKSEGPPVKAPILHQIYPRVENLAQQGGGKITLALDPPEMGRVTIEVTTRGKNVEVAMHSDSEKTRGLLENGLSDLRLAMQSHDLSLTKAEVHGFKEASNASMQFSQNNGGSFDSQQQDRPGSGRDFWRDEKTLSRDLFSGNPVARNRAAGRLDVRV